jgi:alpha-tubulin suppressor-like RCC1 family protein
MRTRVRSLSFELSLLPAFILAGCGGTLTAGCPEGAVDCSDIVPEGPPAVIPLALGKNHSCAFRSDQSLWCWGQNNFGQLGYPSASTCGPNMTDCSLAPQASPGKSAAQVAVGWDHTCVLSSDHKMACWGNDKYGQCGNDAHNENLAVTTSDLTAVVQIAAAEELTCALIADGTARCFGFSHYGQVGDGITKGWEVHVHGPVKVAGLKRAVAIAVGGWHGCALLDDATLVCWGAGNFGQLGFDPPDYCEGAHEAPGAACSLVPRPVPGLDDIVQVAPGGDHTCALRSDGSVWCWGAAYDGQLGDGLQQDRMAPAAVPGLSDIKQISANGNMTCAVHGTGRISCWGSNTAGQLGRDTTTESCQSQWGPCSAVPGEVEGLEGATMVVSGGRHACAWTESNTLACWGSNLWGQLGDGTGVDRSTPVQVAW